MAQLVPQARGAFPTGEIRRQFNIEFKRQVAAAVNVGMPINEAARQHKVEILQHIDTDA